MNKRALEILEYNKIIEMLSKEAGSQMAKDRIARFSPRGDILFIKDLLRETTEACDVIIRKGTLPIGELYDIEPLLYRVRKGGSLTMKELLMILYNMKVTENVVSFLKKDLPHLSIIHGKSEVLVTFPRLRDKIDRSILSEDEMADSASPELARIRREMGRENDAIRAKLNNIVNSQANRTYLQDSIVTMRDGRYVVPVKAEHRQKIAGIVHDQSGSGSTLFIEPQAIVEANNRLRELELMEKAEIERILQELSDNCAEHFHDLLNDHHILIDLDVIFAKGRLSVKMKAEEPVLDENYYLELKDARHPLIDPKKVVPINVKLGGDFKTLVITGPNTGGKTVTLKTIGLLSMMAMSGLHIPASSESRVPVYKEIFCDIGDEQSIEQSLSTFSSHMKNTVEFIDKAGYGSLVLLDELGAGTDPTEGAALAISILETLKRNEANVAATTHYNELKKFAIEREGVQNASMEFDVDTLSPTYRLIIGIPGKSNAFEISRKLGLAPYIIDRANQLIERGDMKFEEVISSIESERKEAEKEKMEADRILLEVQKREAEIERRMKLLNKHEKEVLDKAKEEARDILKDARDTATEVQQELKALAKMDSLGDRTKGLEKNKRRLKEAQDKYSQGIMKEINDNPVSVEDIKVGDKVKVLTLDQTGEILSKPDDRGDMQVQVGVMKIYVNVEDLMLVEGGPQGVNQKKKSIYDRKTGRKGGEMFRTKAMSVSTSINVVGKTLDDATEDVLKYLDDAYVAGLKSVTIIHGRGAGILQNGIRQILKKTPNVDSFRRGNYNEGGDGVTIVKFKD
ncbi:MAG: endonuclease MutS2 [Firmicutes bacterium]|nr:endonuclease MutS2 [Bacillota bacterium]